MSNRSNAGEEMSRFGRQCGERAAVSAVRALVGDLASGEVEASRMAGNVVSAAGKGAAVVACEEGLRRAVVHVGGKQVLRQVTARTASVAARNALKGNAIGQVTSLLVDQGADTIRVFTGDIDAREYGKRTAENAGGAVGGLGGTAAGAALGTMILPGLGTVIGGFVGGVLGSLGSDAAVRKITRG